MSASNKIAITNVRVFDGSQLSQPTTVIIEGDHIGTDTSGATEIDAKGGTLLPGLIDAHVHITKPEQLTQLSRAGVTTALDMACWPPAHVDSMRNQKGVTDIRSAGTPLTAPGTLHSQLPNLPKDALVETEEQAVDFVSRRIAEGSDYIKVVADVPGPTQEVLNAAVAEAKKQGKLTVAHAARFEAVQMAQKAKVDFLTHVPIDKALTAANVQLMLEEDRPCIPTLAMEEKAIPILKRPGSDYAFSRDSVTTMHKAGVPILAGTDANASAFSPIRHGESLHREFELLIEAGMSTVDVLRSATILTAQRFGLHDRGVIEPGKRADLVLIAGDPIKDIKATRQIEKVWCGGIEVS